MSADRFLTITSLAAYRDESPRTTRRWIKQSGIPIYREGASVRVRQSDVDAYMERHRVEPVEQKQDLRSMLKKISADVLQKRKTG